MATIDPTTPEGRAHIRAIAMDAPIDRAVLLTRENVAQDTPHPRKMPR